MRYPFLLLLTLLSGCEGFGIAAGVDVASVVVFGRGVSDIGVSAITGRDCSVVRLDRGKTYCAPREGEDVRAQPFCTRTLGSVTCWDNPGLLPAVQQEVGDAPPPTAEQLRYRQARWPKSLNF